MRREAVVVDSFGQTVKVSTGLDLTGNTGVKVRFRKAGSSTWIEKVAAVDGADVDGVIAYTAVEGDALWDTWGEVRVTGKVLYLGKELVSHRAAKVMVVNEGDM
jgi:hypothetical protein